MAAPSVELQEAVYARLIADADVGAIVGDAVFDGRPTVLPDRCITFGPSDHGTEDLDDVDARLVALQVDCWLSDGGRTWPVGELADAVKAALHHADLELATHALAWIEVTGLRVMLDPDGLTGHGVVSVVAMVEER